MSDRDGTTPAVWDPTANGGAGGWVRRAEPGTTPLRRSDGLPPQDAQPVAGANTPGAPAPSDAEETAVLPPVPAGPPAPGAVPPQHGPVAPPGAPGGPARPAELNQPVARPYFPGAPNAPATPPTPTVRNPETGGAPFAPPGVQPPTPTVSGSYVPTVTTPAAQPSPAAPPAGSFGPPPGATPPGVPGAAAGADQPTVTAPQAGPPAAPPTGPPAGPGYTGPGFAGPGTAPGGAYVPPGVPGGAGFGMPTAGGNAPYYPPGVPAPGGPGAGQGGPHGYQVPPQGPGPQPYQRPDFGVPQQPPGPGGDGRKGLSTGVLVVLVIVVAALLGVGAVWGLGLGQSKKGATGPSSPPVATGTGSPSGTPGGSTSPSDSASPSDSGSPGASAQTQAQAVDSLLSQSRSVRGSIADAAKDIGNCTNLAAAQGAFQSAASNRQTLANQATTLDVSQLPNGSALMQQLAQAERDSANADNAYADYAGQLASGGCSANGQLPQSVTAANSKATNDKNGFVVEWNQIAGQYGLPSWTQNEF